MTLRFRTVLGIAAIEVVLLFILGYTSINAMRESVSSEFVRRAEATQIMMRGVLVDALISSDLASVDDILSALTLDTDIVYAGVRLNDRWLSFSGDLTDQAGTQESGWADASDDILDTMVSVSAGGQRFGDLALGLSLAAGRAEVTAAGWRFAGLAGVGIVLSAIFSFALGSWLSTRAQRLTRAAQRLGQGDLSTVVVDTGNDEFSDLARQFNNMAERLRTEAGQRDAALDEARSKESDLIERTRQVEAYNQMSNLLNVVQLNVILNPIEAVYNSALVQDLLDITLSEAGFIAQAEGVAQSGASLKVVAGFSRSGNHEQVSWVRDRLENGDWWFNWQGSVEDMGIGFESSGRYLTGRAAIVDCLGESPLADEYRYMALVPLIHKGQVVATFGVFRNSEPYSENLESFLQPLITTCSQLVEARDNVTARLEAETQLRENENKIRSILESASDAIMTLTANGVVSSANTAAGEVFGLPSEQLIGLWFGELLEPQLRASLSRGVTQVMALSDSSGVISTVGRRLSGADVPIEMSLSVMESEGEELFTAVVRDVTEKREAQEALRAHSQQLDGILSLSGDGFVAFDGIGQVGYANPAFSRLIGVRASEVASQTIGSLSHRMIGQSDDWHTHLDSLKDGQVYRISLLKPAPRIVEISARTMSDEDGRSLGRVMYFRDVTHQAEVDRMKSEFLSTAAHELRTPLASVYGFSELLMSVDYDKETRDDLLGTIHKQASRLTKLIDELLDLARIEARAGKDFEITPGDLSTFVNDLCASFVNVGDPRKINWNVDGELPSVAYDDSKLAQALNNIISNAFKYSPGGGDVDVGVDVDGGRVGVWVQDSGMGMSPDAVDRVFDRFFRADPSCNIPGTGLGMSVVKEIMDLHGGSVAIESTLNEGTRVTLWLPADASSLVIAS
ncbi:ATP-binding protein [Litorivicinus lipolyticus]|uniref:ATP-binding protein n=1 Tax=Litorivicinus lipolyticus TaxID=418701 RepID=UPI003B5C37EC